MDSISIIDHFLDSYAREHDFYDKIASLCAQQCDRALRRSGIRSLVTHRAKRPESLRVKLIHRAATREYNELQTIRDDIPDLAGVRIAIYFPTDRDAVDEILRRDFDVRHQRVFPLPTASPARFSWQKRFS